MGTQAAGGRASPGQRLGQAHGERLSGGGGGRCQRGNELSENRRRRGTVQCHGNQGSEQVHPGRGGCRSIGAAGREREWEAQGHLSSRGRRARSTFSRVVSAEGRGAGGGGGGLAACRVPEAAADQTARFRIWQGERRAVARRGGGGTGARVWAPGSAWEEAVEKREGGHVVGVHPAGRESPSMSQHPGRSVRERWEPPGH